MSCPRCGSSAFRHHCDLNVSLQEQQAYRERERNERIEERRDAIRAVPEHACPPFRHEQYKADANTFLIHTEGTTEWNDGSMRYLTGACVHCGGSNTIRVGSVAGLEAMRGGVQR